MRRYILIAVFFLWCGIAVGLAFSEVGKTTKAGTEPTPKSFPITVMLIIASFAVPAYFLGKDEW